MSSNVECRRIKAGMLQWVPVGECPATSVISEHSGKLSWRELKTPEFAPSRFLDSCTRVRAYGAAAMAGSSSKVRGTYIAGSAR